MRTAVTRAGLGGSRHVLAPLVLGAVLLGAWHALVVGLSIEPFVLPSPVAIGQAFADKIGPIGTAMKVTGANAGVGLVIGAVIALLAAAIGHLWPFTERLGSPVVTALSVIPIVALAPVLYTMMGAGAQTTRQIIAAISVFVPVYVNALRGFANVSAVHRDLMAAAGATHWQSTWHLTLPSATPYITTGLRVASSLAVISALIAEYFGGPVGGLGKAITSAASSSNYTLAWAYVLGAILLGLIFYGVTAAIEHRAGRG
jgi:NitT/TauT family transport system permease protein